MRKSLLFALLFIVAGAVQAANYAVTGSWTDPTPAGPDYTGQYEAEVKVNTGAPASLTSIPGASFATTATANAGDTIQVCVRAVNVVTPGSPINGEWSAWVQAVAPIAGITPAIQTNISITVTPQ